MSSAGIGLAFAALKFSQSGVYMADEAEKKRFIDNLDGINEKHIEQPEVNINDSKELTDYDQFLIESLSKNYPQQEYIQPESKVLQSRQDASAVDHQNDSSITTALKHSALSTPEIDQEAGSIYQSVGNFGLTHFYLKKLQAVADVNEQCPDQQMFESLQPTSMVGLSKQALMEKYNGALKDCIEGHQLHRQMPQADAFIKAQQAFTSSLSEMMPYVRTNTKLGEQVIRSQKSFKQLGLHLSEIQLAWKEDSTTAGSTGLEKYTATQKHAEITRNLTEKLKVNLVDSESLIKQQQIFQKIQDQQNNLFSARMNVDDINEGLSHLLDNKHSGENQYDVDLSDLKDKAAYNLSLIRSFQSHYDDAKNCHDSIAYKPMSNLAQSLSNNQLDKEAINYQLISQLNQANVCADTLLQAQECPDFKQSPYQESLEALNTHLSHFGCELNKIDSVVSSSSQEYFNKNSHDVNELNQAFPAQIAQVNDSLKTSNNQLQARLEAYQAANDKLSLAQGALSTQLMASSGQDGIDPVQAQAELMAKKQQAQEALLKAQEMYQQLLDEYLKRLEQLQALADKMQATLQSKLDAANQATNSLSDTIAQKFCGKNLADLFQVDDTNSELSSLPPGVLHAVGEVARLSQSNHQDALAAKEQYTSVPLDYDEVDLSNDLESLDSIANDSEQTQLCSEYILNDINDQVTQAQMHTEPKLDDLMSAGISSMDEQIQQLNQKTQQLQQRFPHCPCCSSQISQAQQQINQYAEMVETMRNSPQVMRDQAQQLEQLRNQTLESQTLVNGLSNNVQSLESAQALSQGDVQMYAPVLEAYTADPALTDPSLENAMAIAGFVPPPLPDLESLLDVQMVIPKLTDMANQLNASMACLSGAYGIVDASGAEMIAVSSSAQIKCMTGGPPMPLTVLPFGVNLQPGKPATLPINMIPFLNVKPFSPCINPANPLVIASLGAPSACMPIVLPWLPLALKTQGLSMPLVRQNSQLHCVFTGMSGCVTVMNPGQQTIKVA